MNEISAQEPAEAAKQAGKRNREPETQHRETKRGRVNREMKITKGKKGERNRKRERERRKERWRERESEKERFPPTKF